MLLAMLGIVAMWFRDMPVRLVAWAKHFVVTTLTVDSRDELLFPALIEYMDSRDARRRLNNFTLCSVRQGTAYQSLNDELQQGGRPAAVFSPGEGFHLFVLDGRLMWMKREIQVAAHEGSVVFRGGPDDAAALLRRVVSGARPTSSSPPAPVG